MKKGIWVVLITALMLSHSTSGLSQPYRDNLPIPAFEIYKNMLNFAQNKDFERVERSLQVIRPISETINLKFKEDIEAEILQGMVKKNSDMTIRAIQLLIFLDMKDLMSLGAEEAKGSLEKAKPKFKAAFLDYQLLSPYINAKNFSSDQKIMDTFRRGVATATNAEDLRRVAEKIENELLTALPELKR